MSKNLLIWRIYYKFAPVYYKYDTLGCIMNRLVDNAFIKSKLDLPTSKMVP